MSHPTVPGDREALPSVPPSATQHPEWKAAPVNGPMIVEAALSHLRDLPAGAVKLVAVEVLLADPESLQDDVLESCLYILRDKLRGAAAGTPDEPR